jgi:hypothetical protein
MFLLAKRPVATRFKPTRMRSVSKKDAVVGYDIDTPVEGLSDVERSQIEVAIRQEMCTSDEARAVYDALVAQYPIEAFETVGDFWDSAAYRLAQFSVEGRQASGRLSRKSVADDIRYQDALNNIASIEGAASNAQYLFELGEGELSATDYEQIKRELIAAFAEAEAEFIAASVAAGMGLSMPKLSDYARTLLDL